MIEAAVLALSLLDGASQCDDYVDPLQRAACAARYAGDYHFHTEFRAVNPIGEDHYEISASYDFDSGLVSIDLNNYLDPQRNFAAHHPATIVAPIPQDVEPTQGVLMRIRDLIGARLSVTAYARSGKILTAIGQPDAKWIILDRQSQGVDSAELNWSWWTVVPFSSGRATVTSDGSATTYTWRSSGDVKTYSLDATTGLPVQNSFQKLHTDEPRSTHTTWEWADQTVALDSTPTVSAADFRKGVQHVQWRRQLRELKKNTLGNYCLHGISPDWSQGRSTFRAVARYSAAFFNRDRALPSKTVASFPAPQVLAFSFRDPMDRTKRSIRISFGEVIKECSS